MSEEETSINEISNPTPVSVVWKNLSLKVDIKKFFRVKSTLTVLNNLNGAVHPGQLLAVMGSSGYNGFCFIKIHPLQIRKNKFPQHFSWSNL